MMVENKKAFTIGKIAAVSGSIVDTLRGSIAAYQALAGIPFIGPALGIAAAGAVGIAGGIVTGQIAKQKYGGGSAGAGKISMPSMKSMSAPSGPVGPGSGSGGGTTIVQLNLDGQQIHEAIVDTNNSASQQGRSAFAKAS